MPADIDPLLLREWLETNGIGGFASSTLIGMNTRRYHGLLTAALKPPVGRYVLLSKLEEAVVIGDKRVELSANLYPGAIHPRGFEYFSGFRQDPFAMFQYEVEDLRIEKSVFCVQGENTVVVRYASTGTGSFRLELRPLLAFRDYHSLTHRNGNLRPEYTSTAGELVFRPYADLPPLHLAIGDAAIRRTAEWYFNFEYERERERGLPFTEDLFNPCVLTYDGAAGQTVSIIASTKSCSADDAGLLRDEGARRRRQLTVPMRVPLVERLVCAADQFIVNRGEGKTIIAGYHWFSDWGRDTMIALPGLTLVTQRPEIARQILLHFAACADRGMLPNRFPDEGQAPEYNTVDAALWFFEAVRAYHAYTGDTALVVEKLYPVLKAILEWHRRGTRYNIHADEDGLLFAGEPGSNLTWMDAKVGDWVVTPRIGKPVEIQALWYNALRITAGFASAAGDEATRSSVTGLADLARTSFREKFRNEAEHCLYDVVNGDELDGSIRPNQIFAVSLPHCMLTRQQQLEVVETVERHLLTPTGLRTLSPADPAYQPRYEGDVKSRDGAYHQGTVWPWLLGPFITSYLKVHEQSPQAHARVVSWIERLDPLMSEQCAGQLPEITDAEAPFTPRGCVAQAWSVAEVLRALVENVYPIMPIFFFTAILAAMPLFGQQSSTPVLVELFTSEGCSSCPPADRLLSALDKEGSTSRAEVIVLSEHVDYWNSIGWKDPFSDPQYSNRQRTYAENIRGSSVYTPQMVVDGRVEFVGSDGKLARKVIAEAAQSPKLPIRVGADGTLEFTNGGSSDAVVYVALAKNAAESQVTRGENGGKRLGHVAIASKLVRAGTVRPGKTLRTEARFARSENDGMRVLAFAQELRTGHVIAAALVR